MGAETLIRWSPSIAAAPVNRLRTAFGMHPAPLFSAIAGRAWSAVVAAIRSTVGIGQASWRTRRACVRPKAGSASVLAGQRSNRGGCILPYRLRYLIENRAVVRSASPAGRQEVEQPTTRAGLGIAASRSRSPVMLRHSRPGALWAAMSRCASRTVSSSPAAGAIRRYLWLHGADRAAGADRAGWCRGAHRAAERLLWSAGPAGRRPWRRCGEVRRGCAAWAVACR